MRLSCGCTPDASGYGYCSECTRKLREKIWSNMNEDRKNYDRHFAPNQSSALDRALDRYENEDGGCSCHINPPCDYCVNGRGNHEQDDAE
jgi:hypothetical protein